MAVQWLVAFAIIIGASANGGDFDFRAFDFGDEDTEFFGGLFEKSFSDHETYFPTDFNLGSLDLVAATPKFARMSTYVDPGEVRVARIKRKTASGEEGDDEEDEDGRDGSSEEKSGGSVDDYADRYEQFVSRHFRDRDEQRKQDDAKGGGDGASYEYRFDFGPSDDYERIKQESDAQSRQLAKVPKNCKAREQDGMVCHVCRDPVTDTTSESCSYATAPHHNKFAYVKQKNYNSKDHEKEPEGESEEDDRDVDEQQEGSEEVTQQPAKPIKRKENILVNLPPKPKVTPTKKPVVHHKPGSPKATANGGGYRYLPVDPRSNKERSRSAPMIQHPTYYDFYTHFFPAAAGRSSEKIRQQLPEQAANGSDEVYVLRSNPDEVAKVLADFESRDWSNCKKGKKNDLTCYTCTDSDGVKHEECMYVSESRQVPARILPAASTTQPTATETVLKPTKKTHRGSHPGKKKVNNSQEQKKPTSPKLRNSSAGKPQKLVQLLEPTQQEQTSPEEHQTVKRTVSIMSHVDERGPAVRGGGRVMHYEHQVTHTV
ncbi:hypothetical protein quinque_012849 [Culex quinquefasciatus]